MGIKLSYPSQWGSIMNRGTDCSRATSCVVGIAANSASPFSVAIGKFDKEALKALGYGNSLEDFAKYVYKRSQNMPTFSFINDNKTIVGKKYPSIQFEGSLLRDDNSKAKGLEVMTSPNNESSFEFAIYYPIGLGPKVIPEFKKMIDSVEFLPIPIAKTPSFMNKNETEEINPNPILQSNSNGLQILSHNSFTDSIGFMHVVGEVQNNSPTTATFVQVTGTFYDNTNQVVGTQFTYTNPSDIGAGDKAPFDLTLTSASVPVSEIDHYNVIASSQ